MIICIKYKILSITKTNLISKRLHNQYLIQGLSNELHVTIEKTGNAERKNIRLDKEILFPVSSMGNKLLIGHMGKDIMLHVCIFICL
jgi:hypothetical protein